MPTQTKSDPVTSSVETVTERLADLNQRAVTNSKKASDAYLTSCERTVLAVADSYERAAGATRVEWLATVAGAQADFTREITKAYTSAARELAG